MPRLNEPMRNQVLSMVKYDTHSSGNRRGILKPATNMLLTLSSGR
ncbi:MAG: hypothetical protein R3321_14350 [Nitrososphaeraceae archaeon]|nr:hypothetical protein [Nitrososphaeraceae archaeon]